MAAKRIATSSINWTAFAERVPKEELPFFQVLKAKNDSYIRRVAAQPGELPKIDWNVYKSKINVPGMVDTFQKAYETLKIPYPSDQGLLSKVDEQEKEMKKTYNDLFKKLETINAELKEKLVQLEAQMPYSEMTIEEYYIANPDAAIYPATDIPTMYPHGEMEKEFSRKLREAGKI